MFVVSLAATLLQALMRWWGDCITMLFMTKKAEDASLWSCLMEWLHAWSHDWWHAHPWWNNYMYDDINDDMIMLDRMIACMITWSMTGSSLMEWLHTWWHDWWRAHPWWNDCMHGDIIDDVLFLASSFLKKVNFLWIHESATDGPTLIEKWRRI